MKLLGLLCFLSLSGIIGAQIPIPKREVGFVYKSGSPNATVLYDVYIDLLCGDSKKAFPVVLQVADHYGPDQLQLTTHLFPLPYLRNGFTASKGALVMEKVRDTAKAYKWMEKVFENLANLSRTATHSHSDAEIIEKFAAIAEGMGVTASKFKEVFNEPAIDMTARVEWKYACTRGIAAVPTFMLNDIVVADATQNWTLEQWKTTIDKLINKK